EGGEGEEWPTGGSGSAICRVAGLVSFHALAGAARLGFVLRRALGRAGYDRRTFVHGASLELPGCFAIPDAPDHPDCLVRGRLWRDVSTGLVFARPRERGYHA